MIIIFALLISLLPTDFITKKVSAKTKAEKNGDVIKLSNEFFNIEIGEYGQITSLMIVGDKYPTNYVMNAENSPNQDTDDHQWMGELMFNTKVCDSTEWTESWTNSSNSVRDIKLDGNKVVITYENATEDKGIKDFKLVETYSLVDDKLRWEITVTNTRDEKIEFGDFGLPLAFNEIWPGGEEIYETRVVDHSYVSNESSYIYITRPSGQGQFLVMTPDTSTGAGFEYKDHWRVEERGQTNWAQDQAGWANGLNVFYIHSNVIKKTNRVYLDNTSLFLEPNESKTYAFNFSVAQDETDMKTTLYEEGLIDAVALPGMIFSTDMPAKVDLHYKNDVDQITKIEIECPHEADLHSGEKTCEHEDIPCTKNVGTSFEYLESKTVDGELHHIYEIRLSCLGQNNVHIYYEDGKETVLQFYAIEPVADALETHGDFMVEKTQWDAPGEIYDKVFDDWMMDTQSKRGVFNGYWGWGDDWGLTHGEYLAEKNVYQPVIEQIIAVDEYLDTAIWNGLMAEHQDDYLIHDFLMPEPNTTPTYRGYAYPHIYNTYFSMYQIARKYPEMVDYIESPETYLLRAYNIMKALYGDRVAYNWETGLMGELTTPAIIEALEVEGFYDEAKTIEDIMEKKYNNFKNTKYPYGSEYTYDNTGEEAVYTLAKLQGNTEMMEKIDWKTRACRGLQSVWYHYGVPTTICGENWWNFQYTASLAGYCMDDWLRLQDNDMTQEEKAYAERINYAGKIANLTAINSGQMCGAEDNIGTVSWTYQAEKGNLGGQGTGGGNLHNGWRQMAGEADLGLFGALQILSSDVTVDPVFGLFGYGCEATDNGEYYTIVPKDGLFMKLNLIDEEIYIEFDNDQYTQAKVNKDGTGATFNIKNLNKTAHNSAISFTGLKAGSYDLLVNGEVAGQFNCIEGKDAVVNVPMPETDAEVTIVLGETPENTAPVVEAGEGSETLRSEGFTLKGNATDDGYPNLELTYEWKMVSGPEGGEAKLENSDKLITKGKVTKAGTYEFELVVSDGELSSSDRVTIIVKEDPPLPEVLLEYTFDSIEEDTVLDTSGSNNDGAIVARREVIEGKIGNAIKFNGKTGYVELPKNITKRVEDVTISAHVNLNEAPISGSRLFELGNVDGECLYLSFVEGGKAQLTIPDLDNGKDIVIKSDKKFVPGYWKNITVTISNSTASLYVDGVLEGENTNISFNLADLETTPKNYIGKSQFEGVSLLNGAIDEFYILTKALSAEEIKDRYEIKEDIVLEKVEEVNVMTYKTVKPELPEMVNGILSNGTYGESEVIWDELTKDLYATTGEFRVYGTLEGTDLKAIANIEVISADENPYLVARYSFDEISENKIEDLSGNGHTAVINGTDVESTLVDGKSNSGVLMNRDNGNFIAVQNAGTDFASPNVTISYWLNRQTALRGEAIIAWAKGDWSTTGWFINATSGSPVGMWIDGGSTGFKVNASASGFFGEDEWVNVAITWNSKTQTGNIYRNGVAQEIEVVGSPKTISKPVTEQVLISKNYYGTIMNEFALDDFRVYSTDLDNNFIKGIYEQKLVGYMTESIWTKPGIKPELPSTIKGILGDYTEIEVEVKWNEISSELYENEGKFTVEGIVEGSNIKAICEVVVSETKPENPMIVSFEEVIVETEAGIKPVLPKKVTAKLSDNTIARYNVIWDEISEDKYGNAGEFTVNGSVEGTDVKAICKVVVNGREDEIPEVERTNIAPDATPTAKYTNSDLGGITTINDGFDPVNSNDKSHGLWHNWGEEGLDQWLQYTWENPVTIDATDVYYFTDGGGINMPGSVDFQYLDENGKWKYVEDAVGLGGEADQYNRTTFKAVTTTALRMNLSPSKLGLDVIEWKVYAVPEIEVPTIISISEVDVETIAGIEPVLPTVVTVTYSDGTSSEVNVVWNSISSDLYEKVSVFTVEGTVADSDIRAICNVTVRENKVRDTISSINNNYRPSIVENKLVLPNVEEGINVSIKTTNPEGIIDVDGNITTPENDTEVYVIFTVSDGNITMDTDSIIVKVNGKQEIPDEKLPFDKTDTETGIRVEAKDDVISNEADLKVDKIESGSIYDYVLNIIKDIGKVFISYDIFVEVNGEKVQPTGGNAKVTIPIPSDYNKDNLLLYLINSKGEKISIEFVVKDNNIIFESDLLGIYSLVDTSKGDGKPDLDDDKEEETEDKPQVKPDNKPNNNGSNSGNNNLPATGNEVSMYILTFAILAVAIGYILLLNKKKVRK